MASVQFFGTDNVIQAYKNCDIPAWGLFSGRQLLCRYCGDDINEGETLLNDFLSKIEGSSATYTLKVFELKKGEKIKEKTECDSSFNFKIDSSDDWQQRTERYNEKSNRLGTVLERMDARLAALEKPAEEVPAEEEKGFMATLGAVVQDELINYIQNPTEENIIGKVISLLTNKQPAMQPMRQIAGINTTTMPETAQPKEFSEADVKRLQSAIDILCINDNKIVDHMEKLAIIAQDSPNKFKMLLSMLDTF